MSKFIFSDKVLSQHIAVLGKTGSGKTSTAKLIIEQVVRSGSRVCILDPIKSDWWGLTLDRNGKKASLPFHILGGPKGHIPLNESAGQAIAEVVGSGELPYSIIDMAWFNPGGQVGFFSDFAPRLIRKMKGVLYLVMEEAHLFAPKERSGMGKENMSIHWSKTMATASRSTGIRLIVLTQRVQALHNAVLGSCDTMIAHRMTAPADQEPVIKWLKANTSKEVAEKVSSSLSSLKTGHGWLCSGEAQIFDLIQFPPITTYDNSFTPGTDSDGRSVIVPAVDLDRLQNIIGAAAQEAIDNDPKALRKEVERLKKALASAAPPPSASGSRLSTADFRKIEEECRKAIAAKDSEWRKVLKERDTRISNLSSVIDRMRKVLDTEKPPVDGLSPPPSMTGRSRSEYSPPVHIISPISTARPQVANGNLDGPQQRILNALAWLKSIGNEQPSQTAVAFLAGYTVGGGGFNNPKGRLRSSGLIEYGSGGTLRLTEAGEALASPPEEALTNSDIHEKVFSVLPGPETKLLKVLIDVYPNDISAEELAAASGYTFGSGGFNNPKGRLRSLGLVEYTSPGRIKASSDIFV